MKKRNFNMAKILPVLLVISLFQFCVVTVNSNATETDNKFLSPDATVPYVNLTYSTPVVDKDNAYKITFKIENPSTNSFSDATVKVDIYDKTYLSSRYALKQWASGDLVSQNNAKKSFDIASSSVAAQSVSDEFSLNKKYSELGIDKDDTRGVFPVSIYVVNNDQGNVIASLNTFLLWQSDNDDKNEQKLNLSTVFPYSGSKVSDDTASETKISEITDGMKNKNYISCLYDSKFYECIKNSDKFKSVASAVDAKIAADKNSSYALNDYNVDSVTAAQYDFLAKNASESKSNSFLYDDSEDLQHYENINNEFFNSNIISKTHYINSNSLSTIAFLNQKYNLDANTLNYLSSKGIKTVIATGDDVYNFRSQSNFTLSSIYKYGDMVLILPDRTMSELLAGDTKSSTALYFDSANSASSHVDTVSTKTQRFLAESLITQQELPSTYRDIVLNVSEDDNFSSSDFLTVLNNSQTADWLNFCSLKDMTDYAQNGGYVGEYNGQISHDSSDADSQTVFENLKTAYTLAKENDDFSSIFYAPSCSSCQNTKGAAYTRSAVGTQTAVDAQTAAGTSNKNTLPAEVIENKFNIIQSTKSASSKDDFQEAYNFSQSQYESIVQKLKIEKELNINAISENISVPITVKNDFDQSVYIKATLYSQENKVTSTDEDVTEIESHETAVVKVPAKIIGVGVVPVETKLTSASGYDLNISDSFNIVTYTFIGTAGFIVFVVVMVLFFIMGIYRTVKRGRSVYRHRGGESEKQ